MAAVRGDIERIVLIVDADRFEGGIGVRQGQCDMGFRLQVRIALGVQVRRFHNLFGVLIGVHVVAEQAVVGWNGGEDCHLLADPGLPEGDEEHRHACGQLEPGGHLGRALVQPEQHHADHDVQRGDEAHIGLQEALDAHAKLGRKVEGYGIGDLVDGVQLEVLEAAVHPADVGGELDRHARADAQREAHVHRNRPHGIAYGPAVLITGGRAEAHRQLDVFGLDIRVVVVQLPAAGAHREDAHLDGRLAHELPLFLGVEV